MKPSGYLGLDEDLSEEELKKILEKRVKSICKPCEELKYCPYGPLVEYYPLPNRTTRQQAIRHNERLKKVLEREDLTERTRNLMEQAVKNFNPDDYPEKIDEDEYLIESCRFFGHICPVYFVHENFPDTIVLREPIENIPAQIKNQVIMRDKYQCQNCGHILLDHQLIFDYIIPIVKGGKLEEKNIQILCPICKEKKGDT
ncbi:MAG: HNH endonuclease [Candidatus Hodarchaeota archaeon]